MSDPGELGRAWAYACLTHGVRNDGGRNPEELGGDEGEGRLRLPEPSGTQIWVSHCSQRLEARGRGLAVEEKGRSPGDNCPQSDLGRGLPLKAGLI